jgi:hypothetical protein
VQHRARDSTRSVSPLGDMLTPRRWTCRQPLHLELGESETMIARKISPRHCVRLFLPRPSRHNRDIHSIFHARLNSAVAQYEFARTDITPSCCVAVLVLGRFPSKLHSLTEVPSAAPTWSLFPNKSARTTSSTSPNRAAQLQLPGQLIAQLHALQ